jgi:transcriptional regulator with XRE-family HTH domain
MGWVLAFGVDRGVIGCGHHRRVDGFRFGRSIKTLRERHGWTQQQFGDLVRVSRRRIGRAEHGSITNLRWSELEAIARALDGQLGLDFRWRGEALDRLLDERHAAVVDAAVRLLKGAGWITEVEVTFSIYGERGSIDILAWHPGSGCLAVIEIKSSVADVGNTLIGLDRKRRLAPKIASERGWRATDVAMLLIIGAGTTSRRRVARHRDAFGAALPVPPKECLAWIRSPRQPAPRGIVFLGTPNVPARAQRRRPGGSYPRP